MASSVSPDRRTLLKTIGTGAAGIALVVPLAGCRPGQASAAPSSTGPSADAAPSPLHSAPQQQVPPLLDRAKVDNALARLDGSVHHAMEQTGVPGIAVAVVYQDAVLHAQGYGVREAGQDAKVDADTVFQLASVSKPLASTVVAGVVGRGKVQWTDPVIRHNPSFALKDPYVTRNATFEDLMSHRSGLHTGAGDLLEDLGFDRAYILGHLNQQPLEPFRDAYNYSNFGYTEGGQAAADAMGMAWEDLAQEILFGPLGMGSSSYRHADYEQAANKARIHVPVGHRKWEAKYVRNADAEAPAGGASSSVRDLAQWIRLQLAHGRHEGRQLIDEQALLATHVPEAVMGPPSTPAARTRFYGLGWNVTYDDQARLQLGHSGAFNLGAATVVMLLPGEQLGIVVLANGQPQGIPEAIAAEFFDTAQHGAPTVDWLPFTAAAFRQIEEADQPEVDYSKAPADPRPARSLDAYTGTYANPYYGPLTVSAEQGQLSMVLGPGERPTTFRLSHFDGDTFSFETIGENANGLAGAIFAPADGGRAVSVRLDFYDTTGLGTFTRS
ncbi:serine hydrolase [Zafaria cholistanensis]|uniref:Serine hydrolase n=1 Tax=Zafaria cholistanensis TaxID=1682741 RepID=A0A5A7NTM1_9MICC|nr:serine hydrolase [Zafaria cholistanensis]GER23091.1 serine hydrolase [Zafaria cholistanensis]